MAVGEGNDAHLKYFSLIIMANKTFDLNMFSLYCDTSQTFTSNTVWALLRLKCLSFHNNVGDEYLYYL